MSPFSNASWTKTLNNDRIIYLCCSLSSVFHEWRSKTTSTAAKQSLAWRKTSNDTGSAGRKLWLGALVTQGKYQLLQVRSIHQIKLDILAQNTMGKNQGWRMLFGVFKKNELQRLIGSDWRLFSLIFLEVLLNRSSRPFGLCSLLLS